MWIFLYYHCHIGWCFVEYFFNIRSLVINLLLLLCYFLLDEVWLSSLHSLTKSYTDCSRCFQDEVVLGIKFSVVLVPIIVQKQIRFSEKAKQSMFSALFEKRWIPRRNSSHEYSNDIGQAICFTFFDLAFTGSEIRKSIM